MYFGKCPRCGTELEAIWFEEEEEVYEPSIKYIRRTGRKRRNIAYLECPECKRNCHHCATLNADLTSKFKDKVEIKE